MSLKYEVWVKYSRKWHLIAECLAESDARLIAMDRNSLGDQSAQVWIGERLVCKF